MTIPAAAESTVHPSDSTLSAFLEGRLAGAELGELLDHLSECESCREVYGEASALAEELERLKRMERQAMTAPASLCYACYECPLLDDLERQPYYGNPVLVGVAPTAAIAEAWRDEPVEGVKREAGPVNVIGGDRLAAGLRRLAMPATRIEDCP